MARETRTIGSMEELFAVIPEVFETINADPKLTLQFAANPLLLVEELGFELSDEMRHFAARRMRFSAETFERMVQLEAQIWEHAGGRFDIDSGEALSDVLFERLKLPRAKAKPAPRRRRRRKDQEQVEQAAVTEEAAATAGMAAQLPARVIGHEPIEDPLEYLRDEHPIMEPLLEYRQLESSSARLAPRRVYDRIKQGEAEIPMITGLKFRFKGFTNR
jgi:hypothetical protein